MAIEYGDQIQEISTTSGTGALTLSGATTQHRRFSDALSIGAQTVYRRGDGVDWEIVLGTLTDADTMTPDSVIASSNNDNAVSWSTQRTVVDCLPANAERIADIIDNALQAANNLSDLVSASSARDNLGLGDSAIRDVGVGPNDVAAGDDARIVGALQSSNNLSEVDDATARANLDLGNSATLDVGTTPGTVAAGDDARITGAAQKAANLSDLTSVSAARANLGLGTLSTQDADDVTVGHLSGDVGSPGPSILAGAGAGAGDSPDATSTLAVGSSDLAGRMQIETGGSPSPSEIVCEVTFEAAFIAAPFVILTPANEAAAGVSVWVTTAADKFTLRIGATPLAGVEVYHWNYVAIG